MITRAVGVARLNKLADFLQKLPRTHFDFSRVCDLIKPSKTNQCGTVGCAMGWTPTVFPRLIGMVFESDYDTKQDKRERKEYIEGAEPDDIIDDGMGFFVRTGNLEQDRRKVRRRSLDYGEAANALFGIPISDAKRLFGPEHTSPADGQTLDGLATPKQVAKRIRTYAKWWSNPYCERTRVEELY